MAFYSFTYKQDNITILTVESKNHPRPSGKKANFQYPKYYRKHVLRLMVT